MTATTVAPPPYAPRAVALALAHAAVGPVLVLRAGILPVVWVTVWTAGRAWHVERLLASQQDVDVPVFSMTYYFKSR